MGDETDVSSVRRARRPVGLYDFRFREFLSSVFPSSRHTEGSLPPIHDYVLREQYGRLYSAASRQQVGGRGAQHSDHLTSNAGREQVPASTSVGRRATNEDQRQPHASGHRLPRQADTGVSIGR